MNEKDERLSDFQMSTQLSQAFEQKWRHYTLQVASQKNNHVIETQSNF